MVAQFYDGSNTRVYTYDNILGAGTYYDASTPIDLSSLSLVLYPSAGPYNFYAPTVAIGQPTYYSVMSFLEYSANNDILFMEPINSTGSTVTVSNKCYWVDNDAGSLTGIDAASCNYANSVSAPANDIQLASIYAWAFYDGSNDNVDYKLTNATYSFKEAPSGTATINVFEHGWQVFPNPATNELTVNSAAGVNADMKYQVMDMAGRTALTGSIQGRSQQIDVSMLAAGTYILKMYKGESDDGHAVFVKN